MKYIIILLLISCKVTAQPPSLSSFSLAQQYQLKMYVKYEVDSACAKTQKNCFYAISLRDKRIDSLSIALRKTNDTLAMVRKAMTGVSPYDFFKRDTVLFFNTDNFYIVNGQIVRKK